MAKKYPDISHYHPVTNWTTVKNNVGFLISKATQGTTYVDSTLDSFIKGCEDKKIPYWLYAYLDKGNERAQAEFMVKTCKPKVGKYFVGYILDVEAGNTASNVKSALTYLNSLGVKTMIYTMYAQYSTYKDVIATRGTNCAWWEARYGANNGAYNSNHPCHTGVDLHQFTSLGTCSGVSGKCDLNRLTGTKAESWFTTPISTSNTTTTTKTTTAKTTTTKVPTYTVGKTYKLQTELKVRKGAGTSYAAKKYSQLTANGKKCDKDGDGALDKGTVVTCKAIKKVGSNIWIKCPSGWLAAYYNGNVYIK